MAFEITEDLRKTITIFVLENAAKFNGKASFGAVIGKTIGFDASLKPHMKEMSVVIKEIIAEIEQKPLEDQQQLLLQLNPAFEEEQKLKKKENKEKRSELPELRNAQKGAVVTRIAPEPSKYNHVGHAVSFLLNYMYATKYEGACVLRFDDTNPEKESQEFVDAMQADVLAYLGIQPQKVVFASDYNEELIHDAETLIEKGQAYTCNQTQEEMSLGRRNMKDSPSRKKSVETVKSEWDLMKKGEGDFVLRLKIDMQHKNAVMRDPVIFRVIRTKHYRQNNRFSVWPMYDFESAMLEGKLGITHVLRSNEFDSRVELQHYLQDLFGYSRTEIKQYARFNVINADTQGRVIREKIESGAYIGWDDPRLVTLRALKRRGIVKETYYELAKVLGMSNTNSELDFSLVASINRKILDKTAKRFFFVAKPIEIIVEGAPALDLTLKMHPDQNLGERRFSLGSSFLLEEKDASLVFKDKRVRLIDAITIKGISFESVSYDKDTDAIVHFLPSDTNQIVSVEILMPDNTVTKGYAEKNIETLRVGEVIQFQRFGFCRLDAVVEKEGRSTYLFWYTHD
ncbi:MAG: glutamate--tRNA ligase [Candidatus Woesearchaeota archaeon]